MKRNNRLALYIAYYLSRFDLKAYRNLGFEIRNEAHIKLGQLLGVKPTTLKNMRDQFDSIHEYRAGWYQAPLSSSRVEVVKALEDLEESEIKIIVEDILDAFKKQDKNLDQLLGIFSKKRESSNTGSKSSYVVRGVTGKKAEEHFIEHYNKTSEPIPGVLKDTRVLGCGYDFKIEKGKNEFFVEVKGLSEETGGILFTNKEWETAKDAGDKFFLALVANIEQGPIIKFIKNPASLLNPKMQIHTSINVQWTLNSTEIDSFIH